MLPADLAGTWIVHRRIFSGYEDDPAVRSIVVSYSTSILVNVLTALVGFRLLGQLRFSVRESVLGVLCLLYTSCCTEDVPGNAFAVGGRRWAQRGVNKLSLIHI